MPARWREDFQAGRQRVRDAFDGRAPRPQQPRARPADREEPFINAVLYESEPRPDTAAMAAEIENLRALIGELGEAAETRVAELQALLAKPHFPVRSPL
jgi:hypothetical protein